MLNVKYTYFIVHMNTETLYYCPILSNTLQYKVSVELSQFNLGKIIKNSFQIKSSTEYLIFI